MCLAHCTVELIYRRAHTACNIKHCRFGRAKGLTVNVVPVHWCLVIKKPNKSHCFLHFRCCPPGTRIIYDRKFLLQCRTSPLARTPPSLPDIPGVTSPLKAADVINTSSCSSHVHHREGSAGNMLSPSMASRLNGWFQFDLTLTFCFLHFSF